MTKLTASRAAQLIAAFDLTGVHRVGTPGDFVSGEWLGEEGRNTGAEISTMPVVVNRLVIDEAYIECAGLRIDGLPMFDSPPTADAGVQGKLFAGGEAGEIGYLELPPNSASNKGMRFENTRRNSQHAALVVATRVAGDSLAPINAQFFDAPFGPPVLLVSGAHHALLAGHAQNNSPATLVSKHRRESTQSYNVVGRVSPAAANGAKSAPLVVLTPRTGWWESTAERAGGLVAWLAGLSAAATLRGKNELRRDLHAFATCGHELGHLGLRQIVAQENILLRDSVSWLHLGANLGCASNMTMFLRASESREAQRMQELLVSEGYPADCIRIEPVSAVSGEGRDLTEHGARVLSMAGSNAHFHAASDRWPGNVNAASVAAIAGAVGKWVTEHGQ